MAKKQIQMMFSNLSIYDEVDAVAILMADVELVVHYLNSQ